MSDRPDYRADVTVRNNRILHFIEELGYPNVAQFCQQNKLSQNLVGDFINLKKSPIGRGGSWGVGARKLADALCCEPDDLWSDEQRYLALASNRSSVELTSEQVRMLAGPQEIDPAQLVFQDQITAVVRDAVHDLKPKVAEVISMHYGLPPYDRPHTFEEVAAALGVSSARAHQIERMGLRQLQLPSSVLCRSVNGNLSTTRRVLPARHSTESAHEDA